MVFDGPARKFASTGKRPTGERIRVEQPENHIGVGYCWSFRAAAVAGGAGIASRAFRPHDQQAAGSMRAIEPPPEPTSAMSIDGTLSMYPPPLTKREGAEIPSRNSYSVTVCGSPPSTIAAFAVVPPMSKTMRSLAPIEDPSRAAPATPPAGPSQLQKPACPAPRDADHPAVRGHYLDWRVIPRADSRAVRFER